MILRSGFALALLLLLLLLLLPGGAAAAPGAPHPLFAGDEVIRLTLRGPIGAIRRSAAQATDPHAAELTLHGADGAAAEVHAIRLAARGLSRRRRDTCFFPPLRIEFPQEPAESSLFRGQRRLKLVTHCRAPEPFQQHVLLEYAAYRLLNLLTPLSLRARLVLIDYAEPGAAAPFTTRLGFLIEDVDDAARRNGLVEIDTGPIDPARLSPRDAARFAVFQYMIGNLDWAMNAGPPGELCCHNARLLGRAAEARDGLVPVPYDFDHSGLVDAPYAVVPEIVPVASVRTRRYRGFCRHNAEALAVAAEARAARPALEAALAGTPRLDARSRARAARYLAAFFDDVADAAAVESNLLRTCLR